MMAAPTREIAIGMKIIVLAAVSFLDRSARTARPRPKAVDRPVTATTHQRLFHSTPRMVENRAKSNSVAANTKPSDAHGLLISRRRRSPERRALRQATSPAA